MKGPVAMEKACGKGSFACSVLPTSMLGSTYYLYWKKAGDGVQRDLLHRIRWSIKSSMKKSSSKGQYQDCRLDGTVALTVNDSDSDSGLRGSRNSGFEGRGRAAVVFEVESPEHSLRIAGWSRRGHGVAPSRVRSMHGSESEIICRARCFAQMATEVTRNKI